MARAVELLLQRGIAGPYGLALGRDEYTRVVETAEHGGYPLLDHLRKILEGPIVWAPGVKGAVVLSLRGGDFLFESGQDLSIGYERHDEQAVHLYLEESFSFVVATREAAVPLSSITTPRRQPGGNSMLSVLVALAANLGIATAKGIAAALTGSAALFAETLHSVADAGNEVLLYVAVRRSERPPDDLHPFGHGPERYYWALLAAIGMFLVGGAVSVWEGINALIEPPELEYFWVGVGVLLVALLLDGLSRVVAVRQLRAEAQRRGISLAHPLAREPRPRRSRPSTSRTRST